MKRFIGFFAAAVILATAACEMPHKTGSATVQPEFYESAPVSITSVDRQYETITTFEADVEVYHMNSRTDTAPVLVSTYHLSTKSDDTGLSSRLDMPATENTVAFSIASKNDDTIMFRTNNPSEALRIPAETAPPAALKLFGRETGQSRINLSLVREEARRLSLDMEEEGDRLLTVSLPSSLFGSPNDGITSRRAVFDMANDTLMEIQTVSVLEDGTTVTTTISPMYQEVDGVPIKTGAVTIVDSKAPSLLSGFNSDVQVFDSPDDIPTMSEAEYRALAAEGNVFEQSGITFGNPADLSYTETTVEMYKNIVINSDNSSRFDILLVNSYSSTLAATVAPPATAAQAAALVGCVQWVPGTPVVPPADSSRDSDTPSADSQTPPETPDAKAEKFDKEKVDLELGDNLNAYWFSGFGGFTPDDPSLENIVKEEYLKIEYLQGEAENQKDGNPKPFITIGESQGGLRMLAYAKYLKDNNKESFKRLQGVITISGIDRGAKLLEGGLGATWGRIYKKTDILWRGIVASTKVLSGGLSGLVANVYRLVDPAGYEKSAFRSSEWLVNLMVGFFPDEYRSYLEPAMDAGADEDLRLQQILDMVPNSDFIKENVSETVKETKKLKLFDIPTIQFNKKKVWFVWVYYPVVVWKPVYLYYDTYRDEMRFDDNLPVGYIVGTDSNTLGMLIDPDDKVLGLFDKESLIRTAINLAGAGFETVKWAHIAKCIGIVGLFTNSVQYASDAGRAADMCFHIDDALNDLKGSPENDGFIAKESMYYPESAHPTILRANAEDVYTAVPYNHKTISNKKADLTWDAARKMVGQIRKENGL